MFIMGRAHGVIWISTLSFRHLMRLEINKPPLERVSVVVVDRASFFKLCKRKHWWPGAKAIWQPLSHCSACLTGPGVVEGCKK